MACFSILEDMNFYFKSFGKWLTVLPGGPINPGLPGFAAEPL